MQGTTSERRPAKEIYLFFEVRFFELGRLSITVPFSVSIFRSFKLYPRE